MIAAVVILSLAVVALGVLAACFAVTAEFHKARALNLERWLRGHLLIVRAECAHVSPQAISLVNSLECALPILGPIDVIALRRDLARLGRERDAEVTEAVKAWAERQRAIIAEARTGEPLPGFEANLDALEKGGVR